jgi:hypothetical protein
MRVLLLSLLMACAPDRSGGDDDTDPGPGPDPFPALAAGWSFGECWGRCNGTLSVTVGGAITYEIPDYERYVVLHAEGQLDDGAMGDLRQLYAAIPREGLQSVYGCPDCADGGAEFISFGDGLAPESVSFEFGDPPSELDALHGVLRGWMDALERCEEADGYALSLCEEQPMAIPGDGDPATPGE